MDEAKAPGAPDPAAQLRRWTLTMGRAQQLLLEQWTKRGGSGSPAMLGLASDLGAGWNAAAQALLADPDRLAGLQAQWWQQSLELWNSFVSGAPLTTLATAADKDKRFAGAAWKAAPLFDLIRQSYLLTAQTATEALAGAQGLDAATQARMLFHTRQLLDAMSPSNFLATNPEALEAFEASGGESLLTGLEHLIADLEKGRLTMVDEGAFELGRNIAATPGSVVFENGLFQLIHYAPVTEQVFEIPLLIMPPWINKFYILDLTPAKSFVRFALEQGLSVFMVSWKNPGSELRDATLDTYVLDGFLAAINEVLARTGAVATHMIGYCVAGTTLAATLAYLAAVGGANKVAGATFLTAQVDFEAAGDLKLFIDDAQMQLIEELTQERGYFDGRYMATTFNLLRSNDLMWSYVVNNYLIGKDYMAFDLLYWNSDATNVPAKWHAAYLRDFYRDNRLVRPGAIRVAEVPIDLRTITTPAYVQAGVDDHIAPAVSVYRLGEHWGGPVRFVLAGSGHVAGVINPPAAGKYWHATLEAPRRPPSLAAFRAEAVEHKGSWWPDWAAWVVARAGGRVPARLPGPGIEPAPGRYVREKVGAAA